jgi:hypothetical protein
MASERPEPARPVLPRLSPRKLVILAFTVFGLLLAIDVAHIAASDGFAFDAQAYYLADNYDAPIGGTNAFLYSPPILLAFKFIASIVPWPVFLEAYSIAIGIAAWVLAGPLTPFVIFTPQVASEITLGNIHLFLALVAVAGFRWPVLWSFALLTKVTPGIIGVLWFAFRGEWRSVGWIVGVTAVIAIPTMIVAPDLWVAWIERLIASSGLSSTSFAVPLAVRLPLAIGLTYVGARRNQRWVVPLAAMVALPVLWDIHGLSMLLGVVWFARRDLGPWIRRVRSPRLVADPLATGSGS